MHIFVSFDHSGKILGYGCIVVVYFPYVFETVDNYTDSLYILAGKYTYNNLLDLKLIMLSSHMLYVIQPSIVTPKFLWYLLYLLF